ncbi:hypothetical protein KK141_11205 [Dyella sp. LX-66]|uniref:EKC/KEOPS complex subunit CGI121/TPRKB n=1 Tax=unclassified Dyella TaxID=2634549 RepID=UPI001BE08DE5|nr:MULTISPECIES: EKC/KEOPS complex subunit CGI121/TPRKB [unclassified Dyella]MBT2118908.1 hypothetical protein [Dyella sp. LX-1]MBT2140098.1 hypothetical protein [Dyella sp. LX-66]
MTDPYHLINVSARARSMREWIRQQHALPRTPAEVDWIRFMNQQLLDNNQMDRSKLDAGRIEFEFALLDAKKVIERDGLGTEGSGSYQN